MIYEIIVSVHPYVNELPAGVFFSPFRRAFLKRYVFGDRFQRIREDSRPKYAVQKYPGGGVLPYMGKIGMCRCEGYGFQALYSRIGYINQSV